MPFVVFVHQLKSEQASDVLLDLYVWYLLLDMHYLLNLFNIELFF
jgi:hypothetical protein